MTRPSLRLTSACALAALFVAGLAGAQTTQYILASEKKIGPSKRVVSTASITNWGDEPADFETWFVPRGANGKNPTVVTETLDPGESMLYLPSSAITDKAGYRAFRYTGQFLVKGALGLTPHPLPGNLVLDSNVDLDELLPFGASDVFSADSVAVLNGIHSMFRAYVINMTTSSATCEADVFDASGGDVALDLVTTVKPGGISALAGVRDALGTLANRIGFVEVTCDRNFYPIGYAYNGPSSNVAVVSPVPGPPPPLPAGCLHQDSICYQNWAGMPHTGTKANPVFFGSFQPPLGEYCGAHVRYYVTRDKWGFASNETHGLHHMVINKHYQALAFLNVKGPDKDETFNRHGYRVKHANKAKQRTGWKMLRGVRYHVDYFWNGCDNEVTIKITDPSGNTVVDIAPPQNGSTPNVRKFTLGASDTFRVNFGRNGPHLPGEQSGIDWLWEDPVLELIEN